MTDLEKMSRLDEITRTKREFTPARVTTEAGAVLSLRNPKHDWEEWLSLEAEELRLQRALQWPQQT
jgi:hypothetical protein